MKRLLLAGLAVACLGIGVGVAQNITKALQLSQDSSGAFGVDSSNSVYFPKHVVGNDQASPTVAAAAGTAPTVAGTDLAGTITGGAASTTTVTLTFATAFGITPVCVAQSRNPATSPLAATPSTTGFTLGSMGAAVVDYVCIGKRG